MSSTASRPSWALRRSGVPAWAPAAVLAAVVLVIGPRTADLAAQQYRAGLGLVLWDDRWYGGHHVPGYSVLFPPLASLLGPRLVGALGAVAATGSSSGSSGSASAARARAPVPCGSRSACRDARQRPAHVRPRRRHGGSPRCWRRAGAPARPAPPRWRRARLQPVAGAFLALGAAAWALARAAAGRRWRSPPRRSSPPGCSPSCSPRAGASRSWRSSFWPGLAIARRGGARRTPGARAAHRGGALRAALIAPFRPQHADGRQRHAARRPRSPGRCSPACCGTATGGPARAARRCRCCTGSGLPRPTTGSRASEDPAVARGLLRRRCASCASASVATGPFRVEIPFTDNHWEARWVAPVAPARARLGAPARPRAQRALLRRTAADAGALPRWLRRATRSASWRWPTRRLDYSARSRGALVRPRPVLPARRCGATRTGASGRCAARARSRPARRA